MSKKADAPGWPRLMSEAVAATYLSLSATTLRRLGVPSVRIGRRRLYDKMQLDRFADELGGRTDQGTTLTATEVERRFLESRKRRAD